MCKPQACCSFGQQLNKIVWLLGNSKVTGWLMAPMTRLCQFANFDNMKKESAGGCFNDKTPAAICWRNEMAGAGRRSGWPLAIRRAAYAAPRSRRHNLFPALSTISNLIIIKTSSVTFINPTRVWILEDLQKRARHMLPFCARPVLWTKTQKN